MASLLFMSIEAITMQMRTESLCTPRRTYYAPHALQKHELMWRLGNIRQENI